VQTLAKWTTLPARRVAPVYSGFGMSDQTLRNLERTLAETGDLGVEARLLQERMRSGDLDQRQIRLAAFLDHPAAVLLAEYRTQASDEPIVDPSSRYGSLVHECALREACFPCFEVVLWFRGLSRWGLDVAARAGVIWLRARRHCKGARRSETVEPYWKALDAWLSDPTPKTREIVDQRFQALGGVGGRAAFQTSRFVLREQGPSERERDLARRSLLKRIEHVVREEYPLHERPDLTSVKWQMAAWALSPAGRDVVEDDKPDELPEGPSLRQRAIESETSATRLRAIDTLCRSSERELTVVMESGRQVVLCPEKVGIQDVLGLGVNGPMCSFDLDGVVEVRPGGRA